MNTLKYRALLVDSAASQMQIAASAIDRSIAKAEQLGLRLGETSGLGGLLARERDHADMVQDILVVSPSGETIAATSETGLPDAHRAAVLRRILASTEDMSDITLAGHLYAGRVLHDSGNVPMGAILLVATPDSFAPALADMRRSLAGAFGLLFAGLALAIWPVVQIAFAGTRRALDALDAMAADETPEDDPATADLRMTIDDATERRRIAEAELKEIAFRAANPVGDVA